MDFGITKRAFINSLCKACSALIPENLIKGLHFSSFMSSQYDVYKDLDYVGYVHFFRGELKAYFPNFQGKIVFQYNFNDNSKNGFASEQEKQKYLNIIADVLNVCIEIHDMICFSEDDETRLVYIANLTERDTAKLKEDIDTFTFSMFLWVFGCAKTLNILGLKRVKECLREGVISHKNGNIQIEHEDIISSLPSFERIEDYTWLKKVICEHSRVPEREILKLYYSPINVENVLNEKFPNRQCLPFFGSGCETLYFLGCSGSDFGIISFQAGINAPKTDGSVIVYVDGKESNNKDLQEAVLKGLNGCQKTNWICVTSLLLRSSAFNLRYTLDDEGTYYNISGTIKDECLKAISRSVYEVAEECAWWDWED